MVAPLLGAALLYGAAHAVRADDEAARIMAAPLPEFIAFNPGEDDNERLSDAELTGIATASGGEVRAADPEQAKQFILQLGNDAIAVLTNGRLSIAERDAQLRRMLVENFDLDTTSRLVLGRYWRIATEAERVEYRRLFEAFILGNYVVRLSKFEGETLSVLGAVPSKRGVVAVRSEVESPKRPSMRIDWLVQISADGRYRVVDVAVEGISMAITQRSEFAAIIESNGGRVAGLIDALRDRVI